jgi:tetratricopeptide (TPR) repeat protein
MVVLSVVVALGACSTSDGGGPGSASSGPVGPSARGGDTGPELALSYVPGEAATDVRIGVAQAAVREHPGSLDAHVVLATLFMRRARETSQNVYRVYADDVIRAARALGDDRRVRTLSVMLMIDEHRFAVAADAARGLIAEDASDPTGHLLLGDALLELGAHDAATEAFQAALEARPDLRSYNRAAYMRWLYGDLDGAVRIMDLAIGAGSVRDPESIAWCFADLGAMYLHAGDSRRAMAAADRALALVEGYVPALVVQARALAKTGELEPAIERLQAAVQARPAAEDYLLLAELHERAGRVDDAKAAFAEAERLAEHDPRPLAHALARHGREPTRALALAHAALEQRHDVWTQDTLALALLRTGDVTAAEHAMQEALAPGTRSAELRLHAAMIDAAAGRRARAERHLAAALEIDPAVDPILVQPLRRQLGAV